MIQRKHCHLNSQSFNDTFTQDFLICSEFCINKQYLCAALKEKTFESRAGAHQGLDAILCDLITPGDVQLLQQGTSLTERRKKER